MFIAYSCFEAFVKKNALVFIMLCAKSKIKKCFATQFEISLNRVCALQLLQGVLHFFVAFGFYVAWDKCDRYYNQQKTECRFFIRIDI